MFEQEKHDTSKNLTSINSKNFQKNRKSTNLDKKIEKINYF